MNRKKFFALFSASLICTALIKAKPLTFFLSKKNDETDKQVKVKINPDAVGREKSGKKYG
jgi:hypothetical protein